MSEDRRTRLKRWLESGEVSLQPLTFPQRELWESSPIPVADPSNHICTFIGSPAEHLRLFHNPQHVRIADGDQRAFPKVLFEFLLGNEAFELNAILQPQLA